jgi:hypothetical protein
MDPKGLERRCADLGYSRGVSHALENQVIQWDCTAVRRFPLPPRFAIG